MDLDNNGNLDCANNRSTLAGLAKTCRHQSGGNGGVIQLGSHCRRRRGHRRTSIATARNRLPSGALPNTLELSRAPW
eukprot:2939368-Alexandrium_andersonii.AAC.1